VGKSFQPTRDGKPKIQRAQVDPGDLKKVFENRAAPYKIELHFGKGRTNEKTYGAMVCWESGKEFHGGGDQQMFLCPYDDCSRFFPGEFVVHHLAICPHCKREMYRDRKIRMVAMQEEGMDDRPVMATMYMFSSPVKDLADLLANVWGSMLQDHVGQDAGADVYLKYHPADIRVRQIAQAKQLDIARARRVPVIYPFANIVKDTSAGMTVAKAFHAFLTA